MLSTARWASDIRRVQATFVRLWYIPSMPLLAASTAFTIPLDWKMIFVRAFVLVFKILPWWIWIMFAAVMVLKYFATRERPRRRRRRG
jgi:hypothetical protein